jgi:uncharacterized alkaline shock family protein YloU
MSEQTTDDRQLQQQSPLKTERGTTTIQDGVVSQVAGMAAQEVEGVRMGSGGTSEAVGNIMSAVPGVGRGSESRDVEYGRAIHQIAEAVRTNVIRRVENLLGLRVTEVNITVNDFIFPQQEQQQGQ